MDTLVCNKGDVGKSWRVARPWTEDHASIATAYCLLVGLLRTSGIGVPATSQVKARSQGDGAQNEPHSLHDQGVAAIMM